MTSWTPQPIYLQPDLLPTRDQVEAVIRPVLPSTPREYPMFFRTARNSWWKPFAALGLAVVWYIGVSIIGLVAGFFDGSTIRMIENTRDGGNALEGFELTPIMFLANNVGLGLAIPASMLAGWAVWGQRPRWLSSVEGGFRWRYFLRCMAWTVPVLGVILGAQYLLPPVATDVRWREYSLLMIVGILITTPFQAAGEEYLMRGLALRSVASWFRAPVVGWAFGSVLSSLTFVALHAASDVWLNLFYFGFGMVASWVVWKTGGLEAAIAIHITNNLLSEALMPFTDFSEMFDRSAGSGDPLALIQVAGVAAVGAILVWQGRRSKVQIATAPAAAEVDQALASAISWGYGQVPTPGYPLTGPGYSPS